MATTDTKFVLSATEMNQLAAYLAGRPWGEVHKLMAIIAAASQRAHADDTRKAVIGENS
jgi:hypothetical protein